MYKSREEKISDIDKKLEQLKAQKRALQNREKKVAKKKRDHRLIEVGSSVESVLGRPIEKEDLPKLINFLKQQEARGNYFSNAMNYTPAPSPEPNNQPNYSSDSDMSSFFASYDED